MAANDEQFLKALGTRIAQLRKEQGLSQQALADQLGIAQLPRAQQRLVIQMLDGVLAQSTRA